jgi:hypothetical protein
MSAGAAGVASLGCGGFMDLNCGRWSIGTWESFAKGGRNRMGALPWFEVLANAAHQSRTARNRQARRPPIAFSRNRFAQFMTSQVPPISLRLCRGENYRHSPNSPELMDGPFPRLGLIRLRHMPARSFRTAHLADASQCLPAPMARRLQLRA